MADDILQSLAHDDVPDSPHGLSRQAHERLNPLLIGLHPAEFVLQTLPYAFLYFLKAMIGACQFSLTGEFPNEGDNHAK